jgi:hypothetical protein
VSAAVAKRNYRGKIVVQHLAIRYPFAGVVWQLLHHLIGFERLGFDVYYLEDHWAYVYDPVKQSPGPDAAPNMQLVIPALQRYGFGERWGFLDPASGEYLGMSRDRCRSLLKEADAVFNLCIATRPREEHHTCRRLVYLETDPGPFQVSLASGDSDAVQTARVHHDFFTYAYNIGAPDCLLPTGSLRWHRTRPPVLLDIWQAGAGPAEPAVFTTVGTWTNKGKDLEIDGEKYWWSKHVNFRQVLDVAGRAGQAIELATDLEGGPDYERALEGGFTIRPVVPMSLDLDEYRNYVSSSRGEFTVSKDSYVRTRSGWFSDRTATYLAAGRPVVTQFTGFEKYIPTGVGLLGFNDAAEAVDAIKQINADYRRHARAARELAREYFDAATLLEEIAATLGL